MHSEISTEEPFTHLFFSGREWSKNKEREGGKYNGNLFVYLHALLHNLPMIILGWQKLNLLSHPNATLAPQARLNDEISNFSLSC